MTDPDNSLRFKRIVIAALLAQLIPVIVLAVVVTVYNYLAVPTQNEDQYSGFAREAGRNINLYAGTLATLGMAFWAALKPDTRQVQHGLMTGILVVIIDLAIMATTEAGFDLMVALAMLLKLVAGIAGGYLALRRYQNRGSRTAGHRII